MAALAPEYMTILKKVLQNRFVPYLPPLLGKASAADQTAKQLSRAFSAFVLHKLLDLTPQVAASAVVDDFQDKGIDAIYYDTKSETLYVLQAKLKESEQFKQEEAHAFIDGVRLLLRREFAQFNANVQTRQTDIDGEIDACSRIQLVIPYTGDGVSKSASDALLAFLDDESPDDERLIKQVLYYAAIDITRDLLAEQAYKPVHTNVGLYKYEKIETPRTTYYGVVRLSDLVALHEKEGKALYERNIRYFLGSTKSGVNKAIKATLQDNPADFFYLNNGVTAVCELINFKGTRGSITKLEVRGFSIINGAQTIASAAEFVRQHPGKDIGDAKVMLTLIKATAEGEFGKRVTKARNHQNPVQVANFASLDENQERLRQEIKHLDYEYHYRPEAAGTAGITAITLEEALRALALLQSDPRYSVWLKSEPARFSDPDSAEYQILFSRQLTGATLVNAVLCYRAVRALVLDNEQKAKAKGQERLIYRHGSQVITAAMMKRLRTKIRGAAPMELATIAPLISLPLDQLRQDAFDLAVQHLNLEGPLAYFRNLERTVPFLIDLMKKNYGLTHFQTETNPERLIKLAGEKMSLVQDLAERLARAAPQL